MPLSQLDPSPALILIDLQKMAVGLTTAHPINEIVERSARLAGAFRERGFPVILVNVAGRAPGRTETRFNFTPAPDWTELVPELNQQPEDYTVTKQQVGAFYGTALEPILRRRGVTQVFLTGIATTGGVESTARNAHDRGYNLVLVVDAMTDRDPDAHRNSIEKIFPRSAKRQLRTQCSASCRSKPAQPKSPYTSEALVKGNFSFPEQPQLSHLGEWRVSV
jgi:nicotinamidase-related amidase